MEVSRETKVWQRVTAPATQGQSPQELRILLQNAAERVGLFQNLPAQTARQRELGRQLRDLEQANLACLKGMVVFSGNPPPAPFRPLPNGKIRENLIRGFYLAKNAAAEYTARSVDPDFGLVYQQMAQREAAVCSLVVQFLGEF